MNKRIKLVLIVAVALGAFLWFRGEKSAAPDQKLVKHFDSICDIAEHHIDTPERGVKKIFRYLGKHSPHMLEQLGALFVEIERIEDDAKHDARARLAAKRFQKHAERCEEPMEKFWSAVERDPDAAELAARGFERFGRTIEIVFGGQSFGSLYGAGTSFMLPSGR